MPRGIYPRKTKEAMMKSEMKSTKPNTPVIEHVAKATKVEDPNPQPLLKQMMLMWLESDRRCRKLREMYELAEEAKGHLSEKEFKVVERSVFNDFQVQVLDLSTGVAHAATVESDNSEED